ncbi:MAG: RNA methyltransferase [Bacteroidales bacterium]|nr:RNA methyltransferase [Bacteroidales bacterium]
MITKSNIKTIASLKQQKFRKELDLFVVEGRKMVEELLQSRFETVSVYATEAFLSTHPLHVAETVTEVQLQQMSSLDTPPGVLAVAKIPATQPPDATACFVLALDGIANPGNMGTLIRTAEWFGIHEVVCSNDCVEIWNPKVIQATMGSVFRVNVTVADLPVFLREQRERGKAIYGALLDGENLFGMRERSEGVIVIGSESHGIREAVLPCITRPITIPRVGGSLTESLNAAVAGGIIMGEMTR